MTIVGIFSWFCGFCRPWVCNVNEIVRKVITHLSFITKLYMGQKKPTIYQVTTMLATSKMSYFQVLTTC